MTRNTSEVDVYHAGPLLWAGVAPTNVDHWGGRRKRVPNQRGPAQTLLLLSHDGRAHRRPHARGAYGRPDGGANPAPARGAGSARCADYNSDWPGLGGDGEQLDDRVGNGREDVRYRDYVLAGMKSIGGDAQCARGKKWLSL